MDAYGGLSVDDLLNLPNDDFFSSSSSTTTTTTVASDFLHHSSAAPIPNYSTDFNDMLCIPSDDVAELEWLSTYMDDSFTDFPANTLTAAAVNFRNKNAAAYHGGDRIKRSRPSDSTKSDLSSLNNNNNSSNNNVKSTRENFGIGENELARRCSHCASEKTPQWRTGPMGPKTLCNACGVRYKSGRLVPEYRPAASPTFVLTKHSNSHRKVLELRRQKEEVLIHQHLQ